MSKFKQFKNHSKNDGIQYRNFYPNGYGVSIVQSPYSYGGSEGLWEIAVLKGDEKSHSICYDTDITSDVIGYLTEQEVDDIVAQVEQLETTVS